MRRLSGQASEPVATIETITPAAAAALLEANVNVRNVQRFTVERYAREMAAGRWLLNGEAIQFDTSNRLINGFHRLTARVESETAFRTIVVRGLPTGAIATMDTGRKRSVADELRRLGEASVIQLSGVISAYWRYLEDPTMPNLGRTPTAQESVALLTEVPELREAMLAGASIHRGARLKISVAGALWLITSDIDAEDAEAFWREVRDGENIIQGDPSYALRRAIERSIRSPHALLFRQEWANAVKAWNGYRDGQSMRRVYARLGGSHPEPMPVPR